MRGEMKTERRGSVLASFNEERLREGEKAEREMTNMHFEDEEERVSERRRSGSVLAT